MKIRLRPPSLEEYMVAAERRVVLSAIFRAAELCFLIAIYLKVSE